MSPIAPRTAKKLKKQGASRLLPQANTGTQMPVPVAGGILMKKIVLRMRDGSMVKCSTYSHFSAAFTQIKVVTTEGKVESVPLDNVKAIFFVRDFAGDPTYKPKTEFSRSSPKAGTNIKVTFEDGEILRGKVINLAEGSRGFFLFPADPKDNNEKVFVIRSGGTLVAVE